MAMYDKSTYTSLERISQKAAFLTANSKHKFEFKIDPFNAFAALKNQHQKNINLFPEGIPHLIGATSDCLQCYYGLQLDTYMNGCSHECVYCWAKTELTKVEQWNNPIPIPIDISSLWELFYRAYETDEKFPLREVLLKRTPLRIGSMSDPFLSMEKKYQNTLETLKLLNKYNYPFLLLTRSAMAADDNYLKLMDPRRSTVQFSIPSLNEEFVRVLEPGADSPLKRLSALKKLSEAGIWTTIRLNPLFPNFPDGHYSNKTKSNEKTSFDFFNSEMISTMSEYGCKSLLAGFIHMDGNTTKTVSQKLNVDLRSLMSDDMRAMTEGFKYSTQEVRSYYELISKKCKEEGIAFSTCYLGLGESYFWKDQDLWADKKDCCNLKNNVEEFKHDTREISFSKKLSILYPDMKGYKLFFNSGWLLRMKSFLLKHLWN